MRGLSILPGLSLLRQHWIRLEIMLVECRLQHIHDGEAGVIRQCRVPLGLAPPSHSRLYTTDALVGAHQRLQVTVHLSSHQLRVLASCFPPRLHIATLATTNRLVRLSLLLHNPLSLCASKLIGTIHPRSLNLCSCAASCPVLYSLFNTPESRSSFAAT